MKETVIDSFMEVVEAHPEKDALIYKENHYYQTLTYAELYHQSQKLAHTLKEKGVSEGDRILMVSENRPEWVVVDIASQILGAILVPVHNVLSAAQIKIIADEIEPKIIFVSNSEQLTKVLEVELLGSHNCYLGYFDDDIAEDDPMLEYEKMFLFKEEVFDGVYEPKIEPVKSDPSRVVTIIYTSGTTGQFKGVELTNRNFISNITAVLSWVEITHKDKFLSILPLSHVFERTVGYYIPLLTGATIGYVIDPTKVSEVAQAEKPTIIIAVPRLYEKIYLAVKEKAEKSPVKKVMFKISFDIGKRMEPGTLLYTIADAIVFKKIKRAFGGNIRFFVSGAASLQQEIGEFFDALSIPVLEGYGLTETSPIVATNTVDKRKYGTIGRVLPNFEYKIISGELYVKGPSVFGGYYKNPEKTKEVFTDDGWFKTGDLVKEDKEGFISFDKRKKEIIVLSTGKNIGPAHLEEKMQMSPLINQAYVFGDEKKHVGALIVPEAEKIKDISKDKLTKIITQELDRFLNNQVASYEQIRKFVIIKEPFSVENGMLTPTLKLRRQKIEEVYAEEINNLYKS